MPTPFNQNLSAQQYIAYLDLAGGRNTKKDPHALDRNQLAQSDNTWLLTGNALSKRPGSISIAISAGSFGAVSAGSVGSGVGATGMVEGRFFDQTALVVQGSNNQLYAVPMALPGISVSQTNKWVSIGAISGGTIQAAQIFDPDPTNPNGPDGSLFIVNGVDTPKIWGGPGNTIKPAVVNQLPQKQGVAAPITPKYVAALFGSIFYAGEPTDPHAVYVSNPNLPQQFTVNQLVPTGTITSNSYIPAWIGRGDGFNGGLITGMFVMGSAMIVYKESAIYAFTQVGVIGDMFWGYSNTSSSIGATSPRSIVPFDTFHVFLGIDGVYTFDGTNTRKISINNPDLFDGPTAQILDRTTAIGVRYGNRYLIYFDNGAGTGVPLGYPCSGAWFDFDKIDADGFPCVGTISSMNVGGVAPLRGPKDTGNFAWADAVIDRIGIFNASQNGFSVFSDFGSPITASITGKADYFYDPWGQQAPIDKKKVDSVDILMSFPIVATGQAYTFNGSLTFDQLNVETSFANSQPIPPVGGAIVGQAQVGNSNPGQFTAVLGSLAGTPAYQIIPLFQSYPATGTIVQVGFTETSTYPWTCLGYEVLANRQQRVGGGS